MPRRPTSAVRATTRPRLAGAGPQGLRWAAVALLGAAGAALSVTAFLLARASADRELVAGRGDFDAVHAVLDGLAPAHAAAAERLRAAARRFDGAALLSIVGAQPRPEA